MRVSNLWYILECKITPMYSINLINFIKDNIFQIIKKFNHGSWKDMFPLWTQISSVCYFTLLLRISRDTFLFIWWQFVTQIDFLKYKIRQQVALYYVCLYIVPFAIYVHTSKLAFSLFKFILCAVWEIF